MRVDLGGTFDIADVRARSIVVARIGGRLVAYANVCRHQAVPLDFGADAPMADDGYHLACHQHGALYRPSDGECVRGPCEGERLVGVGVEERAGGRIVVRF